MEQIITAMLNSNTRQLEEHFLQQIPLCNGAPHMGVGHETIKNKKGFTCMLILALIFQNEKFLLVSL